MATGKGAKFSLDDKLVTPVLTDLSSYIREISAGNETEEVDGTVLTSTKREFESTFERDRITLRLKWSPAATTFLLGVKGLSGLNYEYGPNGGAAGKVKISGTANVLKAQTIPNSSPNALTELELELNINSETHATYV